MTEAIWEDALDDEFEADSDEFEPTAVIGHGGRVRYGTHLALEEAADQILFTALRKITSREDKADVLTPWKLKNRISHEVYTVLGVPDPSIRNGMYNRVLNRARPHLNSRDGLARACARQEHTIALTSFSGMSSGDD